MHGSGIVVDLVLLLAGSIVISLVFRRLHLPTIAGYLLVGLCVGPHALGWVDRTDEVETLAELGVVLLLFSVGLEFSLPRLLLQGRRLLLTGGGQVLFTIGAILVLGVSVGMGAATALACGFLVALSSTGFVMKALSDMRQIDTAHGQVTVGVLLFQDLIVVLMMLVIPILGGSEAGAGGVLVVLLKSVAAIAGVVLFARFGFHRLAELVVRLGGREVFVLLVALVTLGTAWFSAALGLSVALGAFIAGLFISESEYSHQVVQDVRPFRDVFNALFFISIGMLLDLSTVTARPFVVASLVATVIAVKVLIALAVVFAVTRVFRIAWATAVYLAQIGEFSFLIAQQAASYRLLDDEQNQLFLAVAVMTMFFSPFFMRLATRVAVSAGGAAEGSSPGGDGPAPDVLVVGYGLNGYNLSRVLKASGIEFAVVELNRDTVRRARKEGVPIHFGDATQEDTLERLGARRAKVIVFAISDPAATRAGVAAARRLSPSAHVIVRTRYFNERPELLRLGADDVIPEEFETSIEIFRRVLQHLHVPRGNIAAQVALVRREGYQVLREDLTQEDELEALREILGDTAVETIVVRGDSPVVGRTIGELSLRERTGATVVSVVRNGKAIHAGPKDHFEAGDVVLVIGIHEAIERCRDVFLGVSGASDDA